MATIRKSIAIDAPVDQVFTYLTQPEHLPEVWPSLVQVTHVKSFPGGAHEFDWVYKLAGIKFHGHADATTVETNRTVLVQNQAGFTSTMRWTYAGHDGKTELSVEMDVAFPVKALKKLAEPILSKLNEHEIDTLLHNVKARLEAHGGGGEPC